jgi:hypothetical protein
MPNERQAVGVLGLAGGEPGGGFDHAGQVIAFGKLAVLGGHSAGDLFEVRVAGQLVIDDGEELFQLRRNLNDRGQHDDEASAVLARVDLPGEGLDDLRGPEEPMQALEDYERRASALGDLRQRPYEGQRVLGFGHAWDCDRL